MSYFITPSNEALAVGLESWQWLELRGKNVVLVTAFADVFLSSDDGIWFLDTLEGRLKREFGSREELERALSTEEGQDMYLLSPFVDRAIRDGAVLSASECYDFKLHPVVGGEIAYENIEPTDFAVALNLRGQLHDQVRFMEPGTKISGFTFSGDESAKS